MSESGSLFLKNEWEWADFVKKMVGMGGFFCKLVGVGVFLLKNGWEWVVFENFLGVGESGWERSSVKPEYHGIFITFKSHLYSKQVGSILLLFGSWSLVLYLHV